MRGLRGVLSAGSAEWRRRTRWGLKVIGLGAAVAGLLQWGPLTPPALAFPQVQITGGSITESGTTAQAITLDSLVGEGFAVTGPTAEGGISSFVSPDEAVPSTSGTLVLQGSDQILTPSFLVNGITYSSPSAITFGGTPMISSPITFPGASAGGVFTDTFPFSFAATFQVFDNTPLIGSVVDGVDAVGGGMAEVTYRSFSSIGPWELQSAEFDFQVPEPSTLLLFGSGLAGLGAIAWNRHHRG